VAQTRDALQTHGKPFEIAALRPFSMGKAAEETKGVKAQNQDFSKKALPSLGGGQAGKDDLVPEACSMFCASKRTLAAQCVKQYDDIWWSAGCLSFLAGRGCL